MTFFRKKFIHKFLSLFTSFSFFMQFRAPVTEPGPRTAYPPDSPSNRPCLECCRQLFT